MFMFLKTQRRLWWPKLLTGRPSSDISLPAGAAWGAAWNAAREMGLMPGKHRLLKMLGKDSL